MGWVSGTLLRGWRCAGTVCFTGLLPATFPHLWTFSTYRTPRPRGVKAVPQGELLGSTGTWGQLPISSTRGVRPLRPSYFSIRVNSDLHELWVGAFKALRPLKADPTAGVTEGPRHRLRSCTTRCPLRQVFTAGEFRGRRWWGTLGRTLCTS